MNEISKKLVALKKTQKTPLAVHLRRRTNNMLSFFLRWADNTRFLETCSRGI